MIQKATVPLGTDRNNIDNKTKIKFHFLGKIKKEKRILKLML